jgi:dCTP deaminase
MLKNDRWIQLAAQAGLITPFEPSQVRQVEDRKVISYGCSSSGYDIRLSPKDFRIFRHVPGSIVDPKCFDERHLEQAVLHSDQSGEYFVIPGNTYGLGVALERLKIPRNITVLCIGKSTYCRVGLIANLSPAEPGWEGHLTLEFSNSSSADIKLYANEGVVQLLFFECEPCRVSYGDRNGKYQAQIEAVTLAKV